MARIHVAGVSFSYSRTATGQGYIPTYTCRTPQTYSETTPATITGSAVGNQSFAGRVGLVAVTTTTALQGCEDGVEATTETSYFFKQTDSSGSTQLVLVGSTSTFSNGTSPTLPTRTERVTYAAPGRIVYESPNFPGKTWTNSPQLTRTTVSRVFVEDRDDETRSVNADGSYTDRSVKRNGTFPYDAMTSIEFADASAQRTIIEGANASAPPFMMTYGAPSNGRVTISTSGTPPSLPDAPPPTPPPSPCARLGCPGTSPSPVTPIYAWYPYVPSASRPLETLSSVDKGRTALPKSCTLPARFPKDGELIESVDETLDVFFGTTKLTTDAYFDLKYGLLCKHEHSTTSRFTFASGIDDRIPESTEDLDVTDSLQKVGRLLRAGEFPA